MQYGFWLEGEGWIDISQDRDKCWAYVNTVMNLCVAQNTGNLLDKCRTVIFSRTPVLRVVSE
jgi:hypothetical protein